MELAKKEIEKVVKARKKDLEKSGNSNAFFFVKLTSALLSLALPPYSLPLHSRWLTFTLTTRSHPHSLFCMHACNDLDELYEEQRKSSDKHADKRSKYFEEAEAAHAAGDFEKAKKLREKAKLEGEKMEQAKKKASEKIFKKK